MIRIYKDFPLAKKNAFKLDVKAYCFVSLNQKKDFLRLPKLIDLKSSPVYILGQGYNTFFKGDFQGIIIHPNIKGVKIVKESKNFSWIKVAQAEDWIKFVKFAVRNNLYGIENLTLIPGSVGAAPVQNISAYGQSLEDTLVSLTAYDIIENRFKKFNKRDCQFSYRDSIFKREKGRYIITDLTVRLSKKPKINLSYNSRYGGITDELKKFSHPPYSIQDIARAITRIRKRKFPDWKKYGTAGSFFLNPIVTKRQLLEIQKRVKGLEYFPLENENTRLKPDQPYAKIPAGWLLEEIGWKGKRIKNVGTSPNQALVVVSYGSVTPDEIQDFTQKMQSEFQKAYKIKLIPEVNIV